MAYRPLWTGLGIIGGYLAALLGLSFYARRRIGARLWRKAHRLTVVVYVLARRPHPGRRHGRLHPLAALVAARHGARRSPSSSSIRDRAGRAQRAAARAGRGRPATAPRTPRSPTESPARRRSMKDHEPTADPHRRRRPGGASAARRPCARRGYEGADPHRLRRAGGALRPPAAVQGAARRRGSTERRGRLPLRRPGTRRTQVELLLGRRARAARPGEAQGRASTTAPGSRYDKLLIATGSGGPPAAVPRGLRQRPRSAHARRRPPAARPSSSAGRPAGDRRRRLHRPGGRRHGAAGAGPR